MNEVFISYSRKDKAFVQKLHRMLSADHRDAWVDWEDIPPTAEFMQEIFTGIEAADTFVFVISPDSAASATCRTEIDHAVACKKRLVPLVYREVDAAQVHPALASHNWLFFREEDDSPEAFATLTNALDSDLDWTHMHTRLLVRAREWDTRGRNTSFLLRGKDLDEAERWLVASADKKPGPTLLHNQYITASRQAATAFQRVWLGAVTFGFVIASILALAAFFAQRQAAYNEQTAIANAATATVAQGAAQSNAATATVAQGRAEFNLRTATVAQGLALNNQQTAIANAATATVAQGAALNNAVTATIAQGRAEFNLRTATVAQGLALNNQGTAIANANTATVAQGAAQNNAVTATIAQGRAEFNLRTATVAQGLALNNQGTAIANANTATVAQGQAEIRRQEAVAAQSTNAAEAKRQVRIALSRQLAAQALYRLRDQPEVALLLSLEASRVADTTDATGSLLEAVKQLPGFTTRLAGPPLAVTSVAFSSDGTYLASGDAGGAIQLWTLKTGKRTQLTGHSRPIVGLAFSPDGKFLVSAAKNDHTMNLWAVPSGQRISQYSDKEGISSGVFSPDAQIMALPLFGGTILLREWTVSYFREFATVENEGRTLSMAFSPDSRYLASADDLNTIRIWDLQDRENIPPPKTITGYTAAVVSLAFSADGAQLVSGHTDDTMIVWDWTKGEAVGQPFRGYSVKVVSVMFGGDMLVSDGTDGRVILWDIGSRLPIRDLLPTGAPGATSIAFTDKQTPVGNQISNQTLAVGGADGSITLWNLRIASWKEFACQKASRNLTQDEWRLYLGDEPYQDTCLHPGMQITPALTRSPTKAVPTTRTPTAKPAPGSPPKR